MKTLADAGALLIILEGKTIQSTVKIENLPFQVKIEI